MPQFFQCGSFQDRCLFNESLVQVLSSFLATKWRPHIAAWREHAVQFARQLKPRSGDRKQTTPFEAVTSRHNISKSPILRAPGRSYKRPFHSELMPSIFFAMVYNLRVA